MKKKILFLLIFLYPLCNLISAVYIDKEYKFFLDYPETWKLNRTINDSALISIISPDKSAIFNLEISKKKHKTIQEFYEYTQTKLKSDGDSAFFNYLEHDAIFSNLIFIKNNTKFRGYFIFIKDNDKYYLISAYTEESKYEQNHDFLLSILNTFALSSEKAYLPGPVSIFYYTKDLINNKNVNLVIEGKTIQFKLDNKEIESTIVLIEREARILVSYTYASDKITPWNRYYNIIFRDNYSRIKPLFEKTIQNIDLENKSKNEKILRIANWIQNFSYEREGTVSDLTPPLRAFFSMLGDCDSRAILFLLFMDYLKIDAIMLVSEAYNHAAVGVDLDIDGAKIKFNNKNYLFIELTEIVDLGFVLKTMADIKKWTPMKIGYNN